MGAPVRHQTSEEAELDARYSSAAAFLINVQKKIRSNAKVLLFGARENNLHIKNFHKKLEELAKYPLIKTVGSVPHDLDRIFLSQAIVKDQKPELKKEVISLAESIFNSIGGLLNEMDISEITKPRPNRFYEFWRNEPGLCLKERNEKEYKILNEFLKNEMSLADRDQLGTHFTLRPHFQNARGDYLSESMSKDIKELYEKIAKIQFDRVHKKGEPPERIKTENKFIGVQSRTLRTRLTLEYLILHAKEKDFYDKDSRKYFKFNKTEKIIHNEIRKFLLLHQKEIKAVSPVLFQQMWSKPTDKKHHTKIAKSKHMV